jgi:5-methylcytosine-specific restriction endonuclease McrA
MTAPKLYVDLIPQSSWLDNVRSAVSQSEWRAITKIVFDRAEHRCQVCNGVGRKHAVEAHERWTYDLENRVQRLVEIVALCPTCHRATHIGLADRLGLGVGARSQLRRVNKWSDAQVAKHIDEAFSTWHERSKIDWVVDISFLETFK